MFMLLFRANNKQTTAFIYVFIAKTTSHDFYFAIFICNNLAKSKIYLHAVLRGNMEQSFHIFYNPKSNDRDNMR